VLLGDGHTVIDSLDGESRAALATLFSHQPANR
jgi:hypothetical protein